MSSRETSEMPKAEADALVKAGKGRVLRHRRDGESHLCLVEVTHSAAEDGDTPKPRGRQPKPKVEKAASEEASE